MFKVLVNNAQEYLVQINSFVWAQIKEKMKKFCKILTSLSQMIKSMKTKLYKAIQ